MPAPPVKAAKRRKNHRTSRAFLHVFAESGRNRSFLGKKSMLENRKVDILTNFKCSELSKLTKLIMGACYCAAMRVKYIR